MKITVITPSLNQRAFIGKTMQSVLEQNYPDIEYIIADGGSTDGTIKIIKNYELRITNKTYKHNVHFKWISKKDRGQVYALNKALRRATGDIIGYINADDYYEKGAFKTVASFFQSHPNAMWISGDCRIVDRYGYQIQKPVRLYKQALRLLPLGCVLPIANPIAQPGTFWRRDVIKKIGYFDEHFRYAFDYEYWWRLSGAYPCFVIPGTLASFRIHNLSKGWGHYKEQLEEELHIQKKYMNSMPVNALHALHMRSVLMVYNRLKKREETD